MALNLSTRGEAMAGPALEDPADIDPAGCSRVAMSDRERIWGIAVNTALAVTGTK